jgi:tetratricopeptide (TPR) repeat protein
MAHSTALVVIARDEAPRIGRLLDSMRPHVDRMLVLDTGSRDDTRAVAQRAGAQVERFAWCDDFAAARNAALSAAHADWHVVLDADEWLQDGAQALAALRREPPVFVGSVTLLNAFDDTHDGVRRTSVARLSRVLPGSVRYAGRIHEQPRHALPVRALPIEIGHDGYLAGALASKRGRNRALLEACVREQPDDAYLWYQLAKDCAIYGEHARADECFLQALALGVAHEPWRHDLAARRLFSLKCLKRHEEGLAFADAQLAANEQSPDYFFALGDLLLDFAADCPQHATALLPMIEAAWQRCVALGERPDLEGAVAGRGSRLAAHNLALLREGAVALQTN